MLQFTTLNVGDMVFHDRTGYPLEYLGEELFMDTHDMPHKETVVEIECNYHK